MQNKPCFSPFIRFSCLSTTILLPSGKPFCIADGRLLLSALLKCSFSLLFVHVTMPSSIILTSPSQPAILFMTLSSMTVLLFAFYKPCFPFFIGFCFPSDSIVLPSSSNNVGLSCSLRKLSEMQPDRTTIESTTTSVEARPNNSYIILVIQ